MSETRIYPRLAGACRDERSGWLGNVHLFAPAAVVTPPWASHERLNNLAPDEIVIADCCCCKMRADETLCTITLPPDIPHGLTTAERSDFIQSNAAFYYDATITIECGPGFGCDVKPRRRSSRHLREWRYE